MRRRWYYIKRAIRADRPFFAAAAVLFLMAALAVGSRDWLGAAVSRYGDQYGLSMARTVMKEWIPAAGRQKERSGPAALEPVLFSYLRSMETETAPAADPAYEKMTARREGADPGKGAQQETGEAGRREEAGRPKDADQAGAEGAGQTHEAPGQVQGNGEASPEEGEAAGSSQALAGTAGGRFPGLGIRMEKLADYDYMMQNFYSIHPTTTAGRELMDAEHFLSMDLSLDLGNGQDGSTAQTAPKEPQILIYHTHSQEGFVDSVPGDNSTTIMGAGEYLSELLREKGFEVMHVTSVYDLVDGELDRNEAYSRAEKEISQILEEYPSIQAVIDLHRDGVNENTHLVTEIDGKPMARFMFFNGLSRTKKNGPIDYLYNPYIEDNLALTLQLKLLCDQYYPGLSRNIYLKSLRYNLHLSDKALLIEVGAQTNTLQEILNTMEPLSVLLAKVFGV